MSVCALLTLALALPALGAGCEGTTSTTSTSQVVVGAGGFYVANDICQPGCTFSIWIYQESNGVPGLQRGDTMRDDTCNGSAYDPDSAPL